MSKGNTPTNRPDPNQNVDTPQGAAEQQKMDEALMRLQNSPEVMTNPDVLRTLIDARTKQAGEDANALFQRQQQALSDVFNALGPNAAAILGQHGIQQSPDGSFAIAEGGPVQQGLPTQIPEEGLEGLNDAEKSELQEVYASLPEEFKPAFLAVIGNADPAKKQTMGAMIDKVLTADTPLDPGRMLQLIQTFPPDQLAKAIENPDGLADPSHEELKNLIKGLNLTPDEAKSLNEFLAAFESVPLDPNAGTASISPQEQLSATIKARNKIIQFNNGFDPNHRRAEGKRDMFIAKLKINDGIQAVQVREDGFIDPNSARPYATEDARAEGKLEGMFELAFAAIAYLFPKEKEEGSSSNSNDKDKDKDKDKDTDPSNIEDRTESMNKYIEIFNNYPHNHIARLKLETEGAEGSTAEHLVVTDPTDGTELDADVVTKLEAVGGVLSDDKQSLRIEHVTEENRQKIEDALEDVLEQALDAAPADLTITAYKNRDKWVENPDDPDYDIIYDSHADEVYMQKKDGTECYKYNKDGGAWEIQTDQYYNIKERELVDIPDSSMKTYDEDTRIWKERSSEDKNDLKARNDALRARGEEALADYPYSNGKVGTAFFVDLWGTDDLLLKFDDKGGTEKGEWKWKMQSESNSKYRVCSNERGKLPSDEIDWFGETNWSGIRADDIVEQLGGFNITADEFEVASAPRPEPEEETS